MEILDMCNMSVEDTKMLNQIYEENCEEYTCFIDKISSLQKRKLCWWATHLSSRNVFLSDSLRKICVVLMCINKVNSNGSIKKILVEDDDIKKTLQNALKKIEKKNIQIITVYKKQKVQILEYLITNVIVVFRALHYKAIIDKTYLGYIIDKNEKNIILIDTEVFPDNFRNNHYESRDFNGLTKYLKENYYYIPNFIINTDITFEHFVEDMKKCDEKRFIFKEKYLHKIDYLKFLLFPWYCIMLCLIPKKYKNIDVKRIVNSDLQSGIYSANSLQCFLNYTFIKRLKKNRVDVKELIGWYEGQPSSNGLFMSFRENYIGKKSVGVEGYALDEKWLGLSPSQEQVRQGASPEVIGVINEQFVKIVKRYTDEVKTVIIPAFRYQHVLEEIQQVETEKFIILIALPGFVNSAKKILKEVLGAVDELDFLKYEVYIKNHPLNQNYTLENYDINGVKCNYRFVDGSYADALQKVNVVVMCKSTTTYETVLRNKLVIVIMLKSELLFTFMPSEWKGIYYWVASQQNEINSLFIDMYEQRMKKEDIKAIEYVKACNEEMVSALTFDSISKQ